MKEIYKKTVSIALVFLMVMSFCACGDMSSLTETISSKSSMTESYFGTVSQMSLYDDYTKSANIKKYNDTWGHVKAILGDIENAVSLSVASSDISLFNKLKYGESMKISSVTYELLSIAKSVYQDTNGKFDVSVYPLVDLWGFTPRFKDNDYTTAEKYDRNYENGVLPLPNSQYIDGLKQLVNFDGIVLGGDSETGYTLKKNIKDVTIDGVIYSAKIDLGGIGKGYAVDKVQEYLMEQGYTEGYFSCGTSSMAILKNHSNSGSNYTLEIKSPRVTDSQKTTYLKVKVSDVTLSSSGDYENEYIIDNIRYCHLINSESGYPINVHSDMTTQFGISTVTVIGGDACYNDALTTAMCNMTLDEAKAFTTENLSDKMVFIVSYNGNSTTYDVWTNIASDKYEIIDNNYTIVQ